MELLFETRLAITKVAGKLYFLQQQPEVTPEPLVRPDTVADGNRVIVRSVIRDGGRYRMWYLAFPDTGDDRLGSMVACAESDNGIDWRKPTLNRVDGVTFDNNYCDLGLCCPSVFIDPDAPSSHHYRATGYLRTAEGRGQNPQATLGGFYTAHSADGLHWELDAPVPRWHSGDTISSVWHPAQRRGIAAMKFVRRAGGIHRRAIWTADLRDGRWADPVCALVPDDFDDVAALARGANSTDYYRMGFLPAGAGTVGLLLNFRHRLPLSMTPEHYAIFGVSDITLVYQAQAGDRWLHAPGRRSFLTHGTHPWNAGWLDGASSPVAVGDEQWLYLTGDAYDHAWHKDVAWRDRPEWSQVRKQAGCHSAIGVARWPAWRLFGCHADPDGVIEIEIGELHAPSELVLNYYAGVQGHLRVQVFARAGRGDCIDIPGRSDPADAVPMTGDRIAEPVRWKQGRVIEPVRGKRMVARITMANAALYAWDVRPVS